MDQRLCGLHGKEFFYLSYVIESAKSFATYLSTKDPRFWTLSNGLINKGVTNDNRFNRCFFKLLTGAND